jgi:hypothetical protein
MDYLYSAYGLVICSDLPLPELVPGQGIADVVIRINKLDLSQLEGMSEGIDFQVTREGIFLFWKNEGDFLIRDGKEIIIDPDPNVDERTLRLIIEGPALGVILHQRGLLPLHAAAIEIGGKVVALMGGVGAGKSTLAAALHKRGHLFVTDDVTAVQPDFGDIPIVFPSFPQLKLWPEVISALGDNPESLPRIEPGTEKRSYRITDGFSQKTLPLTRIYILNENGDNEIVRLAPQRALLELMRHSYRASLLKWIGAERHLSQFASLINKVPVKQLNRPPLISGLHNMTRIVEEDVAFE